jgi:divalent metal cation (Fe/Co/Zn/Cd) transporter
MPALAIMKRRVGGAMGSRTLVADSTETVLCSYLSAILLAGWVLNAAVGWWWADPLAAMGIAALAAREGIETWTGDHVPSGRPGRACGSIRYDASPEVRDRAVA